jgi:hypothetical protein
MSMDVLETQIAQWRLAMIRNRAVEEPDVDELEGHLRDQVADLEAAGLTADEAFLVGVKRLGQVNLITAEFARVHGDRLWKQLVLPAEPDGRRRPLLSMLVFAAIAAVAIQVARLASGGEAAWFYRDVALFVLPVLAAYFVWVRKTPRKRVAVLAGITVGLAAAATFYPFSAAAQTGFLLGIHLAVVLWFVVGIAYLGDGLRSVGRRMDFVRFTGEWAIYYVLIALGGGVLMALTGLVLGPILPSEVLGNAYLWVIPSGATAAVIVAAWLVEAKKSAIENIAPVLAAIFTPLFAVMLVIAAAGYFVTGSGTVFSRDILVAFDAVLIVVVSLVVYSASARKPNRPSRNADLVRLVTVIAAIVVDLLVLASLFGRIGDHGFTANRVAALAVNLLLLVNLVGTAWFSARPLRSNPESIDRWQMRYLPIFGAWAVIAVLVLPLVFRFA